MCCVLCVEQWGSCSSLTRSETSGGSKTFPLAHLKVSKAAFFYIHTLKKSSFMSVNCTQAAAFKQMRRRSCFLFPLFLSLLECLETWVALLLRPEDFLFGILSFILMGLMGLLFFPSPADLRRSPAPCGGGSGWESPLASLCRRWQPCSRRYLAKGRRRDPKDELSGALCVCFKMWIFKKKFFLKRRIFKNMFICRFFVQLHKITYVF